MMYILLPPNLTWEHFAARLKQADLVSKNDFDEKLKE